MLNIAVCDDMETTVNRIADITTRFFDGFQYNYNVDKFTQSVDLLNKLPSAKYDLLLLDIDMPDFSGFDISEKIRGYNNSSTIVYISSCESFVFQSLKYRPFRFIRKRCISSELEKCLLDFSKQYSERNIVFSFKTGDGEKISIRISQIAYFETYCHDVHVHTKDNELYIIKRDCNLKQLESAYSSFGFIRIHKSYLLNFNCINVIKDSEIILKDGNSLPINKKRYDEIKELYQKFIMEDI